MFKVNDIVELPKYHKGIQWKVKSIRGTILYVAPIIQYGSFSPNSSYSTNEKDCRLITKRQSNIPWL